MCIFTWGLSASDVQILTLEELGARLFCAEKGKTYVMTNPLEVSLHAMKARLQVIVSLPFFVKGFTFLGELLFKLAEFLFYFLQ